MIQKKKWLTWTLTSMLILAGLVFFIIPAEAAPVILPTTSSAYAITSSDRIAINCAGDAGADVTLILPNGDQMSFVRNDFTNTCGFTATYPIPPCVTGITSNNWAIFNFNGVQLSGTPYTVATANYIGSIGDGTWSISAQATQVCLQLGTKTTTFYFNESTTCFYNWRSAGTTYSSSTDCSLSAANAEQSPNNFVFFSDQAGTDSDPQPFTEQSSVACGPPPILTMNGIWIRGATQTGNTFTRFASIQGSPPVGVTDLRTQPGVSFTTLTDSGAGASGTNTGTTVYNNAVGNSYQFFARATSTGTEQLGAILLAAPSQCTPPSLGLTVPNLEPDQFTLDASSACNGDDFDIGGVFIGTLATHTITIYIETDPSDVTVLTIPQSQLNVDVGIGVEVYHKNVVLPPGPYFVVGIVTVIATGVQTAIATDAVTVFAGACGNTVVPELGIENFVNRTVTKRDANLTRIENTLNETEEHTDYIMTQNNKSLYHIDSIKYQINTTVMPRLNVTCRNDITTGDCQGIKQYIRQNLTRIELTLNETEQHADDLIAKINGFETNITILINRLCRNDITSGDCQGIKAVVLALHSAVSIIGLETNETEQHTDDLLSQQIVQGARLNVTCRNDITTGDCQGIKNTNIYRSSQSNGYINDTKNLVIQVRTEQRSQWSMANTSFGDIDNHFHQTDSYINQTNASIMNMLSTFVFGGNVTFNDTQIQQDVLSVLNPLTDLFWLLLIITAVVCLYNMRRFNSIGGALINTFAMFYGINNFVGIFRTLAIAISVMIYGICIWKGLQEDDEKKAKV